MNAYAQGILDRLQESLADEYDGFVQIAAGGMGIVYRARHRLLERTDAVKVLFFTGDEADRERRRFYDEARIIAALSHPNIRQVYGARYDRVHDLSYLLMAFIDGENLKERLRRELPSIHGGLSIAREVTQALQYAHSKRVIHRDIKPANILIDGEGHAFLADFGIALDPSVTQSNTVPGTLQYMAPELLRGCGPSAVTDIYSLGHVFSEIFTGRRHNGDFVEESDPGRGLHHYKARIEDDAVAEMLHDLVDRMTSRLTENRPRLCGEVLGRLDQVRRALRSDHSALARAMKKLPDSGDPESPGLPSDGAWGDDEQSGELPGEDRSDPRITVLEPVAGSTALRDSADTESDRSSLRLPTASSVAGETGEMDRTVVLSPIGRSDEVNPSPALPASVAPARRNPGSDMPRRRRPRNTTVAAASMVALFAVAVVVISQIRSPIDDVEPEASLVSEQTTQEIDRSEGPTTSANHEAQRDDTLTAQPIQEFSGQTARPTASEKGTASSAERAPAPPRPNHAVAESQGPTNVESSGTNPSMNLSGADPNGASCATSVRLIMSLPSEQVRMPLLRVWKKNEPLPQPVEFQGTISLEGVAGEVFVVELLRKGLRIEPARQEIVLDPRRSHLELRFEVRAEETSEAHVKCGNGRREAIPEGNATVGGPSLASASFASNLKGPRYVA